MKKSFTLIEVMIVVAIIAVLAGVALPQYNKYVRKAQTTGGIALLNKIVNAEILYFAKHGEYIAITHSNNEIGKTTLKNKLGIVINENNLFHIVKIQVCNDESFIVWASVEGLSPAYSSSKINTVYPYPSANNVAGFVKDKYSGRFFLYDYIFNTRSNEAPNECS